MLPSSAGDTSGRSSLYTPPHRQTTVDDSQHERDMRMPRRSPLQTLQLVLRFLLEEVSEFLDSSLWGELAGLPIGLEAQGQLAGLTVGADRQRAAVHSSPESGTPE